LPTPKKSGNSRVSTFIESLFLLLTRRKATMGKRQILMAICVAAVVEFCFAADVLAVAVAYDVYKVGVPDLDKPNPADNSCWLASAANLLGGTGWGDTNQIYNTLQGHFQNAPGWSSVAINWWIYNHGLNPGSPDYNPNPTNYLDVTIVRSPVGHLVAPEYDSLLNELSRCQYVNVSFEIPGASIGHEMTLVGGNFSPNVPAVSVWHDNQGDRMAGNDDDVFANKFVGAGQFWNIDYRNTPADPNDDFEANGATIFCPGKLKPASAIENFDVAWFKDMNVNDGTLFNTMLVAGEKNGVYTLPDGKVYPEWQDSIRLLVPNEVLPNMHKELWLMVDFIDRNHFAGDPLLNVIVQDDAGIMYNPTDIQIDADGGQALLHWVLPNQPAWESLIFPSLDYNTLYDISTGLGGVVKDWNLATQCVPEPSTFVLLLLAGICGWALRRCNG
jgi:hypothetical protein